MNKIQSSSSLPITVVIPVLNEEKNLAECLHRLKNFQKVFVVDSGSTDNTVNIARDFGAEVATFDWNGKYPKKRNWFLMNYKCDTDWVLFLDADELVTQAFLDELAAKTDFKNFSGYWIFYENYFNGKKLHFGVPQKKLALFKSSEVRYEQIEEERWSHLDMEVHEHPIVPGRIGKIKSKLIHKDMNGLEKFILKHVNYATWEAARLKKLKNITSKDLTFRQKVKYFSIRFGIIADLYFIYTYILNLGFLDGRVGLSYARYKRFYFRMVQDFYRS